MFIKFNEIHLKVYDTSAWTPLMYAAELGYLDIALFLLEQYDNRNDRNIDGNTALMIAESKGHTQVAELLKTYSAKSWYSFW